LHIYPPPGLTPENTKKNVHQTRHTGTGDEPHPTSMTNRILLKAIQTDVDARFTIATDGVIEPVELVMQFIKLTATANVL
jgi:hypothetical protein